jgi:hypothetical protein
VVTWSGCADIDVDATAATAAVRQLSRIDPGTDEQLVVTRRYLLPERADASLDYAPRDLGASVAICLRPQHRLSADLGAL